MPFGLNMSPSHSGRVNDAFAGVAPNSQSGAAQALISELDTVQNSARPAEKFKTNSHNLQVADELLDDISLNSLPKEIREAKFSQEVESAKFLVGVLSSFIEKSNNGTDIKELRDVVKMLPDLDNDTRMQSKFTTMLHKLLVKFGQPALNNAFAVFTEHCREAWKHNTVGHDNNVQDKDIFTSESISVITQLKQKSEAIINAKNWTDLTCQGKYFKSAVVSLSKTLIHHKNNKKQAPTPPPRISSARPITPSPMGVNTGPGPYSPVPASSLVNNCNPIISPVFNNYPGVHQSGDSVESDIKALAGMAGKILKSDIESHQKVALTGRLLDIIEGVNNNQAFIKNLKSVTSQYLTDKSHQNKSTETVGSLMSRGATAGDARQLQRPGIARSESTDSGIDAESAGSNGVHSQGGVTGADARQLQSSHATGSESTESGIDAESAGSRGVNSQGGVSAADARQRQHSDVTGSESVDSGIDAESAGSRGVNSQGGVSAADARQLQRSGIARSESTDSGIDAESAGSRGVNSQGGVSAADAHLRQNSGVAHDESTEISFNSVDGKENGRNAFLNESLIFGTHQEKTVGQEIVSEQQGIMTKANKLKGDNKVEMANGSQKDVNKARNGTGASDKKEHGNTQSAFLEEFLQAWKVRDARVLAIRNAQQMNSESVANVSAVQNKDETTVGSQENLSQADIRTESPDRVELRKRNSTTPADGIFVKLASRQLSLDSQAKVRSVYDKGTEQNEPVIREGALNNNQGKSFDSQVELRNSNKKSRRPASHS